MSTRPRGWLAQSNCRRLTGGGHPMVSAPEKKRILILGGGFAGAYAAKRLEKRLGRASGI